MTTSSEATEGIASDFGLVGGDGRDLDRRFAQETFKVGTACGALATLDHAGAFDPAHSRQQPDLVGPDQADETRPLSLVAEDRNDRRAIDDHHQTPLSS
jgi:hypothetical protein